jgi:NADH-quinone oxidoreductase subunit N
MDLSSQLQSVSILPELILSVFGIIVMLADPFISAQKTRRPLGILAFVGTLAALAASFYQMGFQGISYFNVVRVDTFSVFFHVVVIAISGVAILASLDYLDNEGIRAGEYYGLILFGTVGMCLLSSAIELLMLFIALEISSISTYILAGFRRRIATSAESSLKYFLLGSFATGFFLYGVALIYGATGSTNIATIAHELGKGNVPAIAYLALGLMFIGMGFKVASVPFHVWTPDVYEGAPSPVVALMSTGPKAAAFALMLRVLFGSFDAMGSWWLPLIWISAALSMTVGNIGALMQNNVKRMLAYSSIAHAGYVLVAFAARDQIGIAAAIFYAASYAAMNVGAFAVVTHFGAA